jgi:hypothetical protein
MSSVMPTAKRSHLGSLPIFAKGKTAMDAFSGNDVEGAHHLQAPKAASNSNTARADNAQGVVRDRGSGLAAVESRSGGTLDHASDRNAMCGV